MRYVLGEDRAINLKIFALRILYRTEIDRFPHPIAIAASRYNGDSSKPGGEGDEEAQHRTRSHRPGCNDGDRGRLWLEYCNDRF
ncbi:MAG: hypothetical protein WBD58_01185 [Geitlerinemataceae cyanobacterium]